MATAIRRVDAHWHSALTTGTGEVTLESGACDPLGISWPQRVEDPNGQTSSEDLLAAAQAPALPWHSLPCSGARRATPSALMCTWLSRSIPPSPVGAR